MNLQELKGSLTGVARDAYLPRFDLRAETEKDWEVRRLVGGFVSKSLREMSPEKSATLSHIGKVYYAAVAKLAALQAERIPGEIKREKIKEKYTAEEWINLLVGAVDLEKALAEVRNLDLAGAELRKKLTTIADPEQEEINLRVWGLLMEHIKLSVFILVWKPGAVVKDTAMPDPLSKRLIDIQACRRLAGLLAERIQATGGCPQSQVNDEQHFREGLQEDASLIQDEDIGGRSELSPRQVNIIYHITERGSMNIQDVENLYPDVNRRTLQRDLKAMIEEGLIISEGATHRLIYRASEK